MSDVAVTIFSAISLIVMLVCMYAIAGIFAVIGVAIGLGISFVAAYYSYAKDV